MSKNEIVAMPSGEIGVEGLPWSCHPSSVTVAVPFLLFFKRTVHSEYVNELEKLPEKVQGLMKQYPRGTISIFIPHS